MGTEHMRIGPDAHELYLRQFRWEIDYVYHLEFDLDSHWIHN